jgi:hypothetical protein
VVEALVHAGWDVLRGVDALAEGTDDPAHFARAAQEGRVLVSNDIDMKLLAESWASERRRLMWAKRRRRSRASARSGMSEAGVVTRKGKPVLVPTPVRGDWQSIALATSPRFMEIVERSRASLAAGQGLSAAEMRRRLGLKAKAR